MDSRARGAIAGLFIGDALAMPVHWYYDRAALRRDYGVVRDYLAPKNPHPDSILWRSTYTPVGPEGDILHEQAQYWGKRGVHYHQFLAAGENTLNLKLCRLLIRSLEERGGYDPDDYLERFIRFMTTPGSHRDTYAEEYHRGFFDRYARGVPARECGVEEKHIGGLVGVTPIVAYHREDPGRAREAALTHVALTHRGRRMELAARLLADLLLATLSGTPLRDAIRAEVERGESPYVRHEFERLLGDADKLVVGKRFSPACYVEDSVPAVLYLALKYHGDPEEGLVSNTMLGGDNAYRGAVLGALLGAANGIEAFPARWVEGLREPPSWIR
jgi:ADP-ribosylglycohydrolase